MKIRPKLMLTLVAGVLACGAWAMPPHPELEARLSRDEIPVPYYLAHHSELAARAVDEPHRIPYLDQLRERHNLDENFNALVILVDFSDNAFRTQATSFDHLLFGGTQGTLSHYISQVSYGSLTLVTVNLPGALGWQRAPQTYAYYVNGQNGFGGYPQNAQKLTEDAVSLVNAAVDFSQYDNDDDGYVDALFVVHAGSGAEMTGNDNQIWSHKWATHAPVSVDGVNVYTYSMEPELWSSPGDMTCGVYAHEMGHAAFGLPDFYDYGYDSYGLGRWSLMAAGSWNGSLGNSPAHPDAWSKIRMGVVIPTVVNSAQAGVSLPAVETNAVIYKLTSASNSSQYVLVENRQQSGYDATLPGSGMLIYHVDDAVSGNNTQWYPGLTGSHYQVAIEQADGQWQLEHYTSSGNSGDPYPGSSNNRTYSATSTPNSNDYNGAATGIAVTNISNSGATMTADFGGSAPASIAVISPNGGEQLVEGDVATLRWSSANLNENVKIELNRSYPSGSWVTLVASAPNTGSYPRTVPTGATTTARLRISGVTHASVSDISNANFVIARRSVTVTAPNTAVSWVIGDSADITWTSQNLSEAVNIEINRAYPGSAWTSIAGNVSNTGSYRWRVAGAACTTARIRISGAVHTAVKDTSNTNFSIGTRSLTVSAPNTAVTLVAGDPYTIRWTTTNVGSEAVRIELNRSYPSGTWEQILASTSNTGSFVWTVGGALTSSARVRILGTVHTSVGDTSNANFSIGARRITVTKPLPGAVWILGGADTVRWTSTNMAGNVRVELNRRYPVGTWETISAGTSNTGWYRWVVSGAVTDSARIRVMAVNYAAVGDTCDGNFSIARATIAVVSPNGGEYRVEGDMDTIRWTSSNLTENVKIELNRSYPSTSWVTLAASVPNTGAYPRAIPTGASTTARVRISGVTHTAVSDTSNANFTIARRTLTVTAPNTAVSWIIGDSVSITWSSQNLSEAVNIEINRAYPSTSWTALASGVSNSGTYRWRVAGTASTATRIRISGAVHTTVKDTSNTNFAIRIAGAPADADEELVVVPREFSLKQNYPNPFNGGTTILYDLPEAAAVELRIYNVVGQLVASLSEGVQPAGTYRRYWDGGGMGGHMAPTGTYLCQIRAGNYSACIRMQMIR